MQSAQNAGFSRLLVLRSGLLFLDTRPPPFTARCSCHRSFSLSRLGRRNAKAFLEGIAEIAGVGYAHLLRDLTFFISVPVSRLMARSIRSAVSIAQKSFWFPA
jgi:hypothetical protein